MLDLNDASPQPPEDCLARREYDLDDLSARLADRAAEWVPELFPRGRISADGSELRLANIGGAPPRKEGSCAIKLKGANAGEWFDHSLGKGGGPLSTLGEATGLHGQELLARAAEIVGAAPRLSNGHDRSRRTDEDKAREIAFILNACVPAARTAVETYLKSRALDDPQCQDLLCHPDLTDWARKIGRPAMVAIMRRGDTGQATGGIHRTYLTDDGSAKADTLKSQMMLGPCAGAVQLMPMTADGVLGVGEGIETSLAATKIFGVPVWTALSAGNMRNFVSPPELKRLLIFADRGQDGEAAAWHLHRRGLANCTPAVVVLPRSDDDFAKDLSLG